MYDTPPLTEILKGNENMCTFFSIRFITTNSFLPPPLWLSLLIHVLITKVLAILEGEGEGLIFLLVFFFSCVPR